MPETRDANIAPEIIDFLRNARAGDVGKSQSALEAKPSLIDSEDGSGCSAMHLAGRFGNVPIIEVLLKFKPNMNKQNNDSETPLMLAAQMKQHDAIDAMVKGGANVNFETKAGMTAVHSAAAAGHVATVSLLKSLGAKTPGTVLHSASKLKNAHLLGHLVYDFSLDVNYVDAAGETVLFHAIREVCHDEVLFLLEHGAKATVCNQAGKTPLHIAVESGSLEMAKVLIAFGADPKATDKESMSPIALVEKNDLKDWTKELTKPQPSDAKKAENAARFKAHGNKVFATGENVKAAKFYTLAIQSDHNNKVYFSNRSAANFNLRKLNDALFDARRCIAVAPSWVKGYVRLAATLCQLKETDAALLAIAAGLKVESNNGDLLALKKELQK